MSYPTPYSVYQPQVSLNDANWQPKMASITLWLQKEWSTLEEKFSTSALGSIHDLMEKAPAILIRSDELNDLSQQNLNQIQQHEAQWRQAVDTPHTADHSKALSENAAWRKTFDSLIRNIKLFSNIIADEFSVDNKQAIEEVVRTGPSLLKALDELRHLQQQRLTEIEQCKTNWNDAITARKGKLAELDELVANKQPAVEAAKNEMKAQESELSRVTSEVHRESILMTSLLHQRMVADKTLAETLEKAKQSEQSLEGKKRSYNQRALEHNKQVDRENTQTDEMRTRLDDRERTLTERERQSEATCAERERVRILAEQELEDDRLTLQSESKKLQDGSDNIQRQLQMLCDYRDTKDAQVITMNKKAENLQATVNQIEQDRTALQAMVRDRDSRLQEKGKKLTEANHSLQSASRLRDEWAAESKRQSSQLQAAAGKYSELEASKISINTLNDNITQMLATQNEQMIVRFEANANEKTILIARVKDLEEVVIPGLKGELAQAQDEVSETRTELEEANRGSEITVGELQTQVRHLEQQLSVKEKALLESSSAGLLIMSNPEDQAALEKCKFEHADVAALRQQLVELGIENNELKVKCGQEKHVREIRDQQMQCITNELASARDELRQLNEKQEAFDIQSSTVSVLEQQQLEARTRDTEQRDRVKTLEYQLEGFKGQEATTHRLQAQISECQNENAIVKSRNETLQHSTASLSRDKLDLDQGLADMRTERDAALRDKFDVNKELANMRTERDAALSAKDAALKAQKVACHERAAMESELDHVFGDNKRLAEDYRQLMIERNSLQRRLDITNGEVDRVTREVSELRRFSRFLTIEPVDLVSQEKTIAPQLGYIDGQDEILDNPGISRAQCRERLTSNSDFNNIIGFSSTSTTTDDNHDILNRNSIQPFSSRKRVADDQIYDAQEQRKRPQTEPDVHPKPSPGSEMPGQPTLATGEGSSGAPITNPSTPQCHVYPVADVWTEGFGDGKIPATVVDKLRSQMKAWNKRKPNWIGSDTRRCANSFAGRKTGDWEGSYGCDGCAGNGLVCVAVYQGTVELLPLTDAREVSASSEGYWFKRTND